MMEMDDRVDEQFRIAEPYYTADTSLSDETAVWLFKECNIPVVTRDGAKWFKGVKVDA